MKYHNHPIWHRHIKPLNRTAELLISKISKIVSTVKPSQCKIVALYFMPVCQESTYDF